MKTNNKINRYYNNKSSRAISQCLKNFRRPEDGDRDRP